MSSGPITRSRAKRAREVGDSAVEAEQPLKKIQRQVAPSKQTRAAKEQGHSQEKKDAYVAQAAKVKGHSQEKKNAHSRTDRGNYRRELKQKLNVAMKDLNDAIIVRYVGFSYRKYVNSLGSNEPMTIKFECPVGRLEGNRPYLGIDEDGEFLFWIHNGCLGKKNKDLMDRELEALRAAGVKFNQFRGARSEYSGLRPGGVHYSSAWFTTGWAKLGARPAARVVTPNVTTNQAQQAFFRRIYPVFARVNAAMKTVTPNIHDFLERVMTRLCNDIPASESAHANLNNLFASMSILIGRATALHKDAHSDPYLIETSVTFGNYTGSDFLLPELGVVAEFGPGSLAMFRGRSFFHGVTDWAPIEEGDERRTLVSYVDKDVFESLTSRATGLPLGLEAPSQISPRVV